MPKNRNKRHQLKSVIFKHLAVKVFQAKYSPGFFFFKWQINLLSNHRHAMAHEVPLQRSSSPVSLCRDPKTKDVVEMIQLWKHLDQRLDLPPSLIQFLCY